MANSGTLHMSDGVVIAYMEADGHIDAAVNGNTAGLELAVGEVVVHLGQEPNTRGANPLLALSLGPTAMTQLAMSLLDALGLRHSIAEVVNYSFASEEADFVHHYEGPAEAHVFTHLTRLSDLLTSVSP